MTHYSSPTLWHRLAATCIALCGGLFVALLLSEAMLRIYHGVLTAPRPKIHRTCGPCRRMYELIPGVADINSAGFRGPELSTEKTAGARRIFLAGDSVTFGVGVEESQTFAHILRGKLESQSTEIINAGVAGYNTFNEHAQIIEQILPLMPDMVVLQVCLNDITDPRLHINAASRLEIPIPSQAIPQPDTISRYAASPVVMLTHFHWLGWSALFRQFRIYVDQEETKRIMRTVGREQNNHWWPTYITGELPLDLQPWLDETSAEMRWFSQELEDISVILKKHHTAFSILYIPMAYQLEPGYPFHPEETIGKIAERHGITFINALEWLRSSTPEESYRTGEQGIRDAWHLSPQGHMLIAEGLANRLSPD